MEGGTGAAGQFQAGDTPVVTFSVTDADGQPYRLDDLDNLSFQLAGPVEHYQIVVYYSDLTDTRTAAVYNGDGTYTYTFLTPIPSTYHTVPNDTTDLGEAEGDWGGQPLVDGTYTLAAWAYVRAYRQDGSYYYDAGNDTEDVLYGAATTLETFEPVLADNCASCHGDEFYAHGGSRREVKVCQSCHVAGGEDRYSTTDSSVTPGANIGWNVMIHKIHAGSQLANGVQYAGYPAESDVEGYPNYNLHDYSEVLFPRFPMAAAECSACHEGAADGDVYSAPNRESCGACHDSLDFATGEGHDGGAWPDDTMCASCHSAAENEAEHADPRLDSAYNPGLHFTITGVTGGSGSGGQFLPGDSVAVRFTITDDSGAAVANSSLSSATLMFSGPIDHMQKAFKDTSWISGTGSNTTLTTNATGDYTATFTVPSTYATQENDTSWYGVEDGDWGGQPLVSGTYRVAVAGYRNVTVWDGSSWRTPAADWEDVLVGEDVTTIETRDVITSENCLNCHGTMEFHGEGRTEYEYCVTCHTAGAEDRYSATDNSVTPGVTIDFSVMIHKMHNGSNLTQNYDIAGYSSSSSYTISNFNHVNFPRQDGGAAACGACHEGNEANEDPQSKVCNSCHDSDDASAHVALNTDETYGEACDVCHGPGRDFSVETMHDWLR